MKTEAPIEDSVDPGLLARAAYLLGIRLPVRTSHYVLVAVALILVAASLEVRPSTRKLEAAMERAIERMNKDSIFIQCVEGEIVDARGGSCVFGVYAVSAVENVRAGQPTRSFARNGSRIASVADGGIVFEATTTRKERAAFKRAFIDAIDSREPNDGGTED